jgi:hypothetical protein
MLIRIFSPTECGLIRDADLKKCELNRMTTVYGGVAFWDWGFNYPDFEQYHNIFTISTRHKC